MKRLLVELKNASHNIDLAMKEAKETKQHVMLEEVGTAMNEIIENLWTAKKQFRKMMIEAE